MDSDGELQEARGNVGANIIKENEMNKLRSDSASPSTFSTASSGSPLVRGSSNGSSGFSNIIVSNGMSSKRPAPTSIAAAQLQQQQQLEFTNRLLVDQQQKGGVSLKKNSSKHLSATKHSASSTKAAKSSLSEQAQQQQQQQKQREQHTKVASSWLHQANNNISPPPNYDGSKKVKSSEKIKKNKGDYDDNKSFGYNVAKSLAFRAYRFNEFWSINKMKYMNLACLLMTLVCLITILLFSSSNSSSGNSITTNSRVIPRKSILVDELPGNSAESIDSLDSQPLVGSTASQQQQTASANSNENNLFDNLNLLDHRRDGAKFRRKSELPNSLSDEISLSGTTSNFKTLTNEREIEDLSSNGNNPELPEKDISDKQQTSFRSELEHNSLIDPILSQIFNDGEIGSMFKQALKRASNGSAINGSSGGFNKPIIRKSKNGATIIISSSSTFNNSNSLFNDSSSPFPSLIEKLLPPMFRPLSLGSGDSFLKQTTSDGTNNSSSSSSSNPQAGSASSVATITINSEPIFASPSSPFGISRLTGSSFNPFASFLSSAMDPFSASSHQQQPLHHHNHNHQHPHHNNNHHHHHHHASRLPDLFMEPMAFRAPGSFGPSSLFPSPFASMSGPPSLMSMIIRANQQDQAEEDSTQAPPSSKSQRTANDKEDSNAKNNDALKTQASQQQNSTTGKQEAIDKQSSGSTINNNDSEVETLDMSEFIPVRSSPASSTLSSRLHNFYPPRSMISKPSGSMVIFSSGASPSRSIADPYGFPFAPSTMSSPFLPFMSPPMSSPPQMMFLGGDGDNGPHSFSGSNGPNGAQMLNPILRSFLNNVMSDIVPVASSISDTDQVKDTSNKTGSSERKSSTTNSNNKAARLSSGSNLNPSWTSLSADQLDDDWTNGPATPEASIDRWDEQNPSISSSSSNNKHIRAHHRSDEVSESNLPTESSEVVSGIQFEQQSPSSVSPFERHLEPSFMGASSGGGNFRSPSMTFEKFIETPARIQQVGPGIRFQSLSRADFEEPSESTATISRPIESTSPFFSPRSIVSSSSSRQSSNDDFAPHVGFISRLLNDISRRSESKTNNKQSRSGSTSIIKNRSMEDDFDEGDSSSMNEIMLPQSNKQSYSPANNWPKIRVASARIRMRPINELKASSISGGSLMPPPNSDTIFMSPNHFTIAENGDNDKEGQASSLEPNKPSFDDTMNSMEDRLNHVLSLASHQTFLPNHKQSSANNEEQQSSESSGKPKSVAMSQTMVASSPSHPTQSLAQNNARAAVVPSIPLPPLIFSRSDSKQYQQQAVEQKQQKSDSDNPFTSPTSPLFGFPASSLAQNDLPKITKPLQELSNNNGNSNNSQQQSSSNRQQRSFTYHSNNAVASSLAGHNTTPRAADQISPAESIGRSRFIPLSGPPASVVMGRRLDDGPLFSDEQSFVGPSPSPPSPTLASLGNHQRQQSQQQQQKS